MTEPNEDRHYMADNVLFQLMERQDSAPEVVEDYTVEELDEAETVAREHQAEQDYESHPEVYETESCPNDIASIHSTGDGSEDAAYDRKQRKHSFKPFVCPLGECGRWFSRADSLKQHMYSHQKESIPKPFLLCHIPGCNRSFSRPDDHKQHLSSHIETQHSAEGPYARTEQALVPRPFDFGPYEDRRDPHQDVAHNVSSSFPVNGEEDDSEALKGYKSRRLPSQPKRGCITCRRRRRQCDEVYPECDTCRVGGYNCEGYPSTPDQPHDLHRSSTPSDYSQSQAPEAATSSAEAYEEEYLRMSVENRQSFWSRTAQGCTTCQRRGKQCDELLPHCGNCKLSGFNCEGYQPMPHLRFGKNVGDSASAHYVNASQSEYESYSSPSDNVVEPLQYPDILQRNENSSPEVLEGRSDQGTRVSEVHWLSEDYKSSRTPKPESQQDSLETEEKQLLPYHNNNDTNNSESSQHAIVHRQQIAHLDQRLAELNQETLPLKGYSSSEKELPPQCDICGMAVTSSTELSQHYERVHPKPIQELESRQHASGEISGATTPAFGHGSVASIITSTSEEHAELEAVTKAPEIHRAMTPEPVRSSSIPQPKPPRALEIIELNDSFEEDELVSNGNLPLPQPPYTYPQISLYLKQSAHAIFRQSMEFAEDLRQATGKKAIDWDTFKLEIEVVRERFGVVDEWLARLFDVVDEMADDSDGGFGGKENAKVVLEQFVREFLDMTLGDKGKDGFWDWECEDELNEFKVRAEDCLGALRALDF